MTWQVQQLGGTPDRTRSGGARRSSAVTYMPARIQDGLAVEWERVEYASRRQCQERCDELNAAAPALSKKQASQNTNEEAA